jgi:NAD(P)-dependent dehydrogenase (short-subunit alcohol dehydrogenase family)
LITGGTSGIGLALARSIDGMGGKVAVFSNEESSDSPWLSIVGDVSKRENNERALETTLEKYGRLDAWINNAGVAKHRAIPEYTEEEIDWMLDVNLKGTILGSQVALRHFAGQEDSLGSSIINVISTASLRGIPSESVYCATKWGVRGFTQALAEEAADHGVRVTGVLPGGVDTAFWDVAVDREMPVGDFLTPQQIADGIISVLKMDDNCVAREIVLRAVKDRDFSAAPE